MAISVGVDANVLIALLDQQDVWHSPAQTLIKAIQVQQWPLIYFDCVVTEAISTLARRLREKKRLTETRALLDQAVSEFPAERLFWVTPNLPKHYGEALALMRQSEGELNFNDALIALACRDYAIPTLASFDADFDRVPWMRRLATPTDVASLAQA